MREHWYITSDHQLIPISNCMLRGMLDVKGDQLVVEKPNNNRVKLAEENIPPHMHHSSVTTGAGFPTMAGVPKG